ncbi:hypothetical protein E8E12_004462 [Didymella heteroderae]|uniref:Uncharacterized protein n=1 Tax=Didymella heteroderae TaxID=1769908 RepID=A0A9P4WRL5_9PLEO|nr:hypothetical protein E8E12_004462 [Didymella heteroderae]
MINIIGLMSTLIPANHVLSYHSVLDSFGHISVRNPNASTTFFIALQLGVAQQWCLDQQAAGGYLIANGSPMTGTIGG